MDSLRSEISKLTIAGRQLYNEALSYRDENGDPGIDNEKLKRATTKWNKASKLNVELSEMQLVAQTRKESVI